MEESRSKEANDDSGRLTELREVAISVLSELRAHGYEAYLAGGCVRDHLMGLLPTDYDIATSAQPDEVKTLFRRVQLVGESFGVMLVLKHGFAIEVATFRTDGVYADGRHPESVTYSDAEHDAQRRDFTINGMFEDPIENRIIDFVGGQADLKDRLIRGIGDPMQRLREDRLRLLRGIRFAARFGFSVETETAEAIRFAASELIGVSRERIGQELRRMFENENRGVAAWELQYHGLDEPVLNEPHQVVAPMLLGRLPEDVSFPATLAAWLIDRHGNDAEHWNQHADRWAAALVLSNEQQHTMKTILKTYRALRDFWPSLGVAAQKRLAANFAFNDALLILQGGNRQQFVEVRRDVESLSSTPSGLNPRPLVSGDDLIRAGLRPGPSFKEILEAVYDAQLEGSVASQDDALALASYLAEHSRKDGEQ